MTADDKKAARAEKAARRAAEKAEAAAGIDNVVLPEAVAVATEAADVVREFAEFVRACRDGNVSPADVFELADELGDLGLALRVAVAAAGLRGPVDIFRQFRVLR